MYIKCIFWTVIGQLKLIMTAFIFKTHISTTQGRENQEDQNLEEDKLRG